MTRCRSAVLSVETAASRRSIGQGVQKTRSSDQPRDGPVGADRTIRNQASSLLLWGTEWAPLLPRINIRIGVSYS